MPVRVCVWERELLSIEFRLEMKLWWQARINERNVSVIVSVDIHKKKKSSSYQNTLRGTRTYFKATYSDWWSCQGKSHKVCKWNKQCYCRIAILVSYATSIHIKTESSRLIVLKFCEWNVGSYNYERIRVNIYPAFTNDSLYLRKRTNNDVSATERAQIVE